MRGKVQPICPPPFIAKNICEAIQTFEYFNFLYNIKKQKKLKYIPYYNFSKVNTKIIPQILY
jgi:hypothetical protein